MKKIISILLLGTIASLTSVAFEANAQEGVNAPNVVAPSQPASTTATAGATDAAAQPEQPGLMGMAMPFLVMLAIMYFLMIRPQQKKMKEHQALLSNLKRGDEVVTTSGILGKIAEFDQNDTVVSLEVSKNVQLRVLKTQVNQVVTGKNPVAKA